MRLACRIAWGPPRAPLRLVVAMSSGMPATHNAASRSWRETPMKVGGMAKVGVPMAAADKASGPPLQPSARVPAIPVVNDLAVLRQLDQMRQHRARCRAHQARVERLVDLADQLLRRSGRSLQRREDRVAPHAAVGDQRAQM